MNRATPWWLRAAVALCVALTAGCAQGDEQMVAEAKGSYAGLAPDEVIERVRGHLFAGPIRRMVDPERIDPAAMPDEAQLGITARWRFDQPIAMAFIRAAGLKWLRLGVGTNPGEEQKVLDMAREHGINVIAMLGYGPVMEKSPAELAEWYLAGSIPLIEKNRDVIKAVQIWNEPFNFPRVDHRGKRRGAWVARYGGRWYGGPYVEPFARFTAATARGLRERFPGLVLVGGTKQPGSTLDMLKAHPAPLDAIYLQPYPRKWPPELLRVLNDPKHQLGSDYAMQPATATVLSRAREVARNPGLELWITEIGATTYEPAPGAREAHHPPVSEVMQAKIYARIWASYLSADVARLFYFMLNDERRSPAAHKPERNFAVVAGGWRPKPAYFVLARLNLLTRGQVQPDPAIRPVIRGATGLENRARTLKAYRNHAYEQTSDLLVRGFATADGARILAVWDDSVLPGEEGPRQPVGSVQIGLDREHWSEALIFDPMTGRSVHAEPVPDGDRVWIEIDIRDYPLLVVAPKGHL